MRPLEKSTTHSKTTQATLVETQAVAAQAGCAREVLWQSPPVRKPVSGVGSVRVRVQGCTGELGATQDTRKRRDARRAYVRSSRGPYGTM